MMHTVTARLRRNSTKDPKAVSGPAGPTGTGPTGAAIPRESRYQYDREKYADCAYAHSLRPSNADRPSGLMLPTNAAPRDLGERASAE